MWIARDDGQGDKMKRLLAALALIAAATLGFAAPAPYPVTVDSRNATAPGLRAYRANSQVYRVTFRDGTNDSTGVAAQTPYMTWSTNSTASTYSTSSWARVAVAASNAIDFTFSPASLNYTAGLYFYEVGLLTSGGSVATYRTGTLQILGSPYSAGAAPITWATNVINGSLYTFTAPWPTSAIPASIVSGAAAGATAIQAESDTIWAGVSSNVPRTADSIYGVGQDMTIYASSTSKSMLINEETFDLVVQQSSAMSEWVKVKFDADFPSIDFDGDGQLQIKINGALVSTNNASDLSSGSVPLARLAGLSTNITSTTSMVFSNGLLISHTP